jgi:hypothetical protein
VINRWKRFLRRLGFYKVPLINGEIVWTRIYLNPPLTAEQLQEEIDAAIKMQEGLTQRGP